jgi:hypothetical protein
MSPQVAEVGILAKSPEEADHRLKTAIGFDEAPNEIQFKIISCELLQEDVPDADDEQIAEDYKAIDTRTLN